MSKNRDNFSKFVLESAKDRVSNHCSFEGCWKSLSAASEEGSSKVSNIGVGAHICAAAPGGKRYDPLMTKAERGGIENCIWMCQDHARQIDTDAIRFTKEKLLKMKCDAEQRAKEELGVVQVILDLSKKNDPNDHVGKGYALHKQEKFAEAIAEYSSAIKLNQNCAELYHMRANSFYGLQKYLEASKDYSEAIKLNPNRASYYYDRGDAYYNLAPNKNYIERAIFDYSNALELGIACRNECLYYRANAYYANSNYKEAINDFTVLINEKCDSLLCYAMRANAYYANSNYKEAINDFTVLINSENDNLAFYEMRANSYMQILNYKEAISDFTTLIESGEKQIAFFENRAICYYNLQKFYHAIRDYTEVINLEPSCLKHYHDRGDAYDGYDDYKKAITDYSVVLNIDPLNTPCRFSRGKVHFVSDTYEDLIKAISDFSVIIDEIIDNDIYYKYRGDCHYKLHQFEEAINDYNEAIKLNGEKAIYYEKRGEAYYFLGNKYFTFAINDFTKAIELEPCARYYIKRGRCYQKIDSLDSALKDFESAKRIDPRCMKIQEYDILEITEQNRIQKGATKGMHQKGTEEFVVLPLKITSV